MAILYSHMYKALVASGDVDLNQQPIAVAFSKIIREGKKSSEMQLNAQETQLGCRFFVGILKKECEYRLPHEEILARDLLTPIRLSMVNSVHLLNLARIDSTVARLPSIVDD